MPITVRLNGKIITTRDGAPAFEMIVQDITEERRKEDELRQTQKMEAIGKLAGGIAHDFNNLLTVIGGNVELIEDGLPSEHPLRGDVDQIREATARAAGLTTQLLAFSRKERPEARTVDVNAVLTNMERMLVRLIGEDIRLETRLAHEQPHISIDSGELEQVVMNLVLNARDAMPMGGRVTVETRCAAGPGGDESEAPGVVLAVRDTGVGMDTETRKRIFEPFYTTKPMGEGTGLGLSTVYGIVQRAEGVVHVESEPGFGTTIDIWLPLASAHTRPEPKSVKPSQPATAGGGEHILVAEDEELVRVFVRRALQDAGYRVVAAADGQEALEHFETDPSAIDLVLTDVVMPRMKGPELASRIAEISPETPILYMSGYVDNQALSTQLADRPDALLRKPFSAADLCERVRKSLDRPVGRQSTG
jgi:nitrogen-specific signal transduction histidine kinase/CheY-like chemotaxis protein